MFVEINWFEIYVEIYDESKGMWVQLKKNQQFNINVEHICITSKPLSIHGQPI